MAVLCLAHAVSAGRDYLLTHPVVDFHRLKTLVVTWALTAAPVKPSQWLTPAAVPHGQQGRHCSLLGGA